MKKVVDRWGVEAYIPPLRPLGDGLPAGARSLTIWWLCLTEWVSSQVL